MKSWTSGSSGYSHTEQKNLKGKENENKFKQGLLHLFHDSSVQIHK